MAARTRSMTWVVIATLVGLFAILAYLLSPAGDADWGEPGDELAGDEDDARRVGADGPASIGPQGREPSEPSPPAEEPASERFDPDRLGQLLVDGGGRPVDPGAIEPPPPPPPPPTAVERAEGLPPAPMPERVAPTPPERALRRAVFWRDLLESRIDATRRQAEAAREAGNDGLAVRYERQAARLERERPAVDARIAELEAAAPPPEEPAAPEEPEAPIEPPP